MPRKKKEPVEGEEVKPKRVRKPAVPKDPNAVKVKKERAPRKVATKKKINPRWLEPGDLLRALTNEGYEMFVYQRRPPDSLAWLTKVGFFSIIPSLEKNEAGEPKKYLRIGITTPLRYNQDDGCFEVHHLNAKWDKDINETFRTSR